MTTEEAGRLSELQEKLVQELRYWSPEVRSGLKGLDALNRDLTVTMVSALQTLVGAIAVLMGVNMSGSVKNETKTAPDTMGEGVAGPGRPGAEEVSQ